MRQRLFKTLFCPLNNCFKQEDHSERQQGLNNKGVRIWVVPLGKTINTFELYALNLKGAFAQKKTQFSDMSKVWKYFQAIL